VLSQQGITLGSAGSGTVVALVSGLATALLGLLAAPIRLTRFQRPTPLTPPPGWAHGR